MSSEAAIYMCFFIVMALVFLLALKKEQERAMMRDLYSSDQRVELNARSVAISNFKISNTALLGSWDASVTVLNRRAEYESSYYSEISCYIYYMDEDNEISSTMLEPFHLMGKMHKSLELRFSNTDQYGQDPLRHEVVEEIKKELQNGIMHFTLKILLTIKFDEDESDYFRSDYSTQTYGYCWDLMAGMTLPTGNGTLIYDEVDVYSCYDA